MLENELACLSSSRQSSSMTPRGLGFRVYLVAYSFGMMVIQPTKVMQDLKYQQHFRGVLNPKP